VNQFSVSVIENLTHHNYIMHPYPQWILDNDLESDMDNNQAWIIISNQVAPYMLWLAGVGGKPKEIGHDLLQPLVDAMVMEGYYNLKPACYNSDEINPKLPTCWQGSPFITEFGPSMMSDEKTFKRPDTTVVGADQFHRASSLYPFHHPLLNGSCSLNTTGPCSFESVSVTENIYNKLDDFTKNEKF
jgi:hypothetical protein